MTIREKYSNYIPLFVSVTMTLNGIITILAVALPIINKIFSININAEIPSDVYSINMKYNSGLGVIIPLVLDYFMIIIAKVSINVKEHFGF
ncbi:hypothetical protein JPFTNV_07830 [Francisella tularensis subsp. holarctica]|uniref:hypothetical protein n=1 Tax=Francisella tularensis TaxID=263 RepID=UPI0002E95DE1|nr:hypothetical protein [Francisella tularensis]KIP31409.1 putative membrane protein [Francisella tularensis subsp. holarctica]MCC9171880.1 hypothetical protein [Francisella tularensis]BCL52898.1 hypothetical protein JPFTNV_07830 [Francisella tularensis subsp. holarctica]BCL55248.1 hypothetical protein JPFTKU_10620 [Francisella tularensis subsp. holarctica]